jgi:hypothetical protein
MIPAVGPMPRPGGHPCLARDPTTCAGSPPSITTIGAASRSPSSAAAAAAAAHVPETPLRPTRRLHLSGGGRSLPRRPVPGRHAATPPRRPLRPDRPHTRRGTRRLPRPDPRRPATDRRLPQL